MAKIEDGFKKLKSDISAKNISGLYLFWGQEDYLREFYLEKIKDILLPKGLEELNYKSFEGKDVNLALVMEAVDALPVFSERTIVEVRDFDIYKCAADKKDAVQGILSDIPDYCCLIFVYTSPDFKPDGRTKLHTLIKDTGLVVEFQRQEQSDLINWIRRRFTALNLEIERGEAEYLIFYCGGLMNGLITEIEKIGAFAKGKKITRSDIEEVGTPALDAVVFKLADALSTKNYEESAKILGELLVMRESPIMILAVVGKQVRQLFTAKLAIDSGRGVDYIQKLWGMRSSYPARLLMDCAKKLSTSWCRESVLLCAETDLKMKSTGIDGEILIKELFIKLAAGEITSGKA